MGWNARTIEAERPAAARGHVEATVEAVRTRALSANRLKDLSDIVLAALILVVTLPLLFVAIAAIRLDSPGPLIFRQARVGRNGRHFTLYKLRTMHVDNDPFAHSEYVAALIAGRADREQGMFKLTRDPRITRAGRILRRLSIDELPQLWNVLRRDMSIVGPRPALPDEVAQFDARTRVRMRVRPGLTGLAQVRGRCLLSFRETVELDVHYVTAWSWWLELWILARTPLAVLSRRGAA